MTSFEYVESLLVDNGKFDTAVTHRMKSGWNPWKSVIEYCVTETECVDLGKGMQDSDKASTDVRGRAIGIGEGIGK